MLLEAASVMMEKLYAELREAEPEKREEFIKQALNLVELTSKTLRDKTTP